jgi:hypothetical protein
LKNALNPGINPTRFNHKPLMYPKTRPQMETNQDIHNLMEV